MMPDNWSNEQLREDKELHNKTIDYYEKNAASYVKGTIGVPFESCQNKFLELLPEGSKILDFGCGSGRDAKYFSDRGYIVDAVDGSEEMCKCARQQTGLPVRKMLFSELAVKEEYDGIWACASILHLPLAELAEVFCKMIQALKKDGIIYTSFKYGEFSGMRNGRYFTDFTKESFGTFISEIKEASIKREWITNDVRPDQGGEQWLNLILQKLDMH